MARESAMYSLGNWKQVSISVTSASMGRSAHSEFAVELEHLAVLRDPSRMQGCRILLDLLGISPYERDG